MHVMTLHATPVRKMSLLWPDLKEFCHSFFYPLSLSPLYPVSPELRTSGCANMLIGCSGSQGVNDFCSISAP